MAKYKFDTTDLPSIKVIDENGTVVTSIDVASALTDTVDNLKDDVEKSQEITSAMLSCRLLKQLVIVISMILKI